MRSNYWDLIGGVVMNENEYDENSGVVQKWY